MFIPIHFFIEQLGWGCRGCAEGFRLVGTEEKGSFKEVTDGARGTGQRKFARCWNRAADQTFPPAAPWIGINGSIGGGSFCFLSKRPAIVGNNLLSVGLKKGGGGGSQRNFIRQSGSPVSFFSPRLLRNPWDPQWERSRNFSKRRARETWPRWRSFYLGSASLRARAAGFLGPVEAAVAADTAPPLIRSPVCSGRFRNGGGGEVVEMTTDRGE